MRYRRTASVPPTRRHSPLLSLTLSSLGSPCAGLCTIHQLLSSSFEEGAVCNQSGSVCPASFTQTLFKPNYHSVAEPQESAATTVARRTTCYWLSRMEIKKLFANQQLMTEGEVALCREGDECHFTCSSLALQCLQTFVCFLVGSTHVVKDFVKNDSPV